MSFQSYFNEISSTEAKRQAREDALDYGHELSGVETGRRVRFGVGNADGGVDGEGKSKKERIARTLEWLLLNDAEYARLHGAVMTAIRQVAQEAQDMITLIETELAAIRGILADIMDNAARLPDGTKVFKDKNGVVMFANGDIVPEELADTVQWTGHEPSYEYMRRAQRREAVLRDALHEVRGIEVEIGGHQDELTNNETPVEAERISDVAENISSMRERMERLQAKLETNMQSNADLELVEAIDIDVPTRAQNPVIPSVDMNSTR